MSPWQTKKRVQAEIQEIVRKVTIDDADIAGKFADIQNLIAALQKGIDAVNKRLNEGQYHTLTVSISYSQDKAKMNKTAVVTASCVDGGGGANFIFATISLTPGSVGAGASVTLTAAVTGLTTSHYVFVGCQSALEDGLVEEAAWASAANMISVKIYNTKAAAVSGAARTWFVLAWLQSHTLSKASLWVDNNLVGDDTASPFTWDLDTTKYSNGDHKLKVGFWCASGGYGEKEETITLDNIKTAGGGGTQYKQSGGAGTSTGGGQTTESQGCKIIVYNISPPSGSKIHVNHFVASAKYKCSEGHPINSYTGPSTYYFSWDSVRRIWNSKRVSFWAKCSAGTEGSASATYYCDAPVPE